MLVDKPMAVNAAEGERMLAAASAHSKQVGADSQTANSTASSISIVMARSPARCCQCAQ